MLLKPGEGMPGNTYIVSETGPVFYRINGLWPENDKSSDQGDGAGDTDGIIGTKYALRSSN